MKKLLTALLVLPTLLFPVSETLEETEKAADTVNSGTKDSLKNIMIYDVVEHYESWGIQDADLSIVLLAGGDRTYIIQELKDNGWEEEPMPNDMAIQIERNSWLRSADIMIERIMQYEHYLWYFEMGDCAVYIPDTKEILYLGIRGPHRDFYYFDSEFMDWDRQSIEERALEPAEDAEEEPVTQYYETVFYGAYEQDNNIENGKEPIEWIVLNENDGIQLLLAKYALDMKAYDEHRFTTWECSNIRVWLNEEFYDNAFSDEEKEKIIFTENVEEDSVGQSNYGIYNYVTGTSTWDKVYLLNKSDLDKYMITDEMRKCEPTAFAIGNGVFMGNYKECYWWLRNFGDYNNYALYVAPTGEIVESGSWLDFKGNAIRPAITIKK